MSSHAVTPEWTQLPPLSLYVHIPWCVRKCPYCDFNSHGIGDANAELPEADYVEALLDDLDEDLHWAQGRPLTSIFIGGGTPSLFSAKSFKRLLHGIQLRIPLAEHCEITLEANPGTFEQDKFSGFREAGINRLSIGIQSFQSEHLKRLGRIHDGQEALKAANIAKKAGFSNFNLDLMHGLPNQSLAEAMQDVQTAIELNPTHISWYQLTLEPNTEFYSKPPQLPDDEHLWDIQDQGQTLLAKAGYQQYEVSAYAQTHRRSTHNLNYWTFGDYLGIGAGAHGKLTLLDQQRIIRTQKTRVPRHYLDVSKAYRCAETPIESSDLVLEYMMNALRLTEGTPLSSLAYSGLTQPQLEQACHNIIQKGWLEINSQSIRATPLGQRFLNALLEALM